ncbi:hypothetical protein [Aureimonas glaciei]|uniref:Uncharacterized protein n=1 Tax=Aureimonas glaciei TaxID=1776957 RepID=A0A917D9A5_9HYPH|nr:hypothetical protein [Aureimonas glaciei]GGD11845.1 hypothetical protein GCM10011335_13520 [Aureimonas glaciei]
MTSTLRQQADYVALTGREIAHQAASQRQAGKTEQANLTETRLPILRDAYATLDRLAKEDGNG